jgi:small-conductance mechanosensitive channel/CRP-like cAMP-binding protein
MSKRAGAFGEVPALPRCESKQVRVVPTAFRFLIALLVVAIVSWQLTADGNGLPIVPHSISPTAHQLSATIYSVVWWIALAVALSGAVSLIVATIVNIRGASGHRALRFISDGAGIIIFGIAVISLSAFVFQFPFSTLLATSSIVAVVLGFALQNTVADLLSGLALSIEQPFRIGDRIDLGDRATGRVVEMNWRATHLLGTSGDVVVVPNSVLSRGRIINHDSRLAPAHRSSVIIKLGNDEAPGRAAEVLRTAALRAKDVLNDPPPRVEVAAYTEWAIDYKILFYFKNWGDETLVASNVFQSVWSHLAWAGIAHPAPRQLTIDASDRVDETRALPAMLKHIHVFEHLTGDERARLAAQLQLRPIGRGTRIIEQGGSDHSLFVVRDGMFDVHVKDEAGVDRIVARLFPGDYVGEASLLTGAPRNASVEAASPATVYEIDKAHFEPFLNERPEMAETLAAMLVERNAARDAALVTTNGATHTTLAQVAGQIRAFFRH